MKIAGIDSDVLKVSYLNNGREATGWDAFRYDAESGIFTEIIFLQFDDCQYDHSPEYYEILRAAEAAELPEAETVPETADAEQETAGVSPSFKQTMDDYEAFFDEYIEFYKNYLANPTDMNLLMQYATFMSKYETTMNSMENLDTSNLSSADYAYYIEVTARIPRNWPNYCIDVQGQAVCLPLIFAANIKGRNQL